MATACVPSTTEMSEALLKARAQMVVDKFRLHFLVLGTGEGSTIRGSREVVTLAAEMFFQEVRGVFRIEFEFEAENSQTAHYQVVRNYHD